MYHTHDLGSNIDVRAHQLVEVHVRARSRVSGFFRVFYRSMPGNHVSIRRGRRAELTP